MPTTLKALRLPLILAITLALALVWRWIFRPEDFGFDFAAYWSAALNLVSGQPLYQLTDSVVSYIGFTAYRYPPVFALTVVPLLPLGFELASLVWSLVQLATWGLSLALVWDGLGRPTGLKMIVATGLLLASWPLFSGFTEGNVSLFLAAALAFCWWAERRGRSRLAALAALTATVIKLTPAPALAWLAGRGRGRAIFIALAIGAGAVAVSLLVPGMIVGWLDFADFTTRALLSGDGTSEYNLAPAWVALRIGALPAGLVGLLSAAIAVSSMAVAYFVGRRLDVDRGWAVAMIAVVLGAPVIWGHSLAPLYVAGAIVAARTSRTWRSHLVWIAAAIGPTLFLAADKLLELPAAPLVWLSLAPLVWALRRPLQLPADHADLQRDTPGTASLVVEPSVAR